MTRAAWKRLRAALVYPDDEVGDACVVCGDFEGCHQPDCPLRAYEDAVVVQSALHALACIGLAVATREWSKTTARAGGVNAMVAACGYGPVDTDVRAELRALETRREVARAAMLGLEDR